MARPRLLTLSVSLITLALSLLGVAWAARGELPLTTALSSADAPRIAAAATGPLIANDHEGHPVLTAAGLAPGETRTGDVTITNAGTGAGTFELAAEGAETSPALSEVLELKVLELGDAGPVAVFTGPVARFDAIELGRLEAGGARRYRFSVTYPTGRPAALDNPLQGASTTIALVWRAAGVDTGSAGEAQVPIPADAPGARTVPAPGRSAGASPSTRTLPLKLRLTRHRGAVRDGVLRARVSASIPARARLSGTITVRGRVTRLRPQSVRVAPARHEIHVRIPRAVRTRGAGRRAVIKLTLSAATAGQKATVRRTLPVTLPRHGLRR